MCIYIYILGQGSWDTRRRSDLLLLLDRPTIDQRSTYLKVATGNACAGQSNENPVAFVTRNPTSFTDGNCGLLLDAGSKNRTRDATRCIPEYAGIGPLLYVFSQDHALFSLLPIDGHWKSLGGAQKGDAYSRGGAEPLKIARPG